MAATADSITPPEPLRTPNSTSKPPTQNRRLSYDHSSNPHASDFAALSLGTLPGPSLVAPPSGQRSVPALERHIQLPLPTDDHSSSGHSSSTATLPSSGLNATRKANTNNEYGGPISTHLSPSNSGNTESWTSNLSSLHTLPSSRTTSWTDETSPRVPSPKNVALDEIHRTNLVYPIEHQYNGGGRINAEDLSNQLKGLKIGNTSAPAAHTSYNNLAAQLTPAQPQANYYAQTPPPVQTLWSSPLTGYADPSTFTMSYAYPAPAQTYGNFMDTYTNPSGGNGHDLNNFGNDYERNYRAANANVLYPNHSQHQSGGVRPRVVNQNQWGTGNEIGRRSPQHGHHFQSPSMTDPRNQSYNGFDLIPAGDLRRPSIPLLDFTSLQHATPFASGLVGGAPLGYANVGSPVSMSLGLNRNGTMRGALLEEFRLNRHRRWDILDIRGHINEFSGDQIGSRHIQSRLETTTPTERQMVFDETLPNLLILATDVFANYVVQKMVEVADTEQLAKIVTTLKNSILKLSLQMYGCRVVQKVLEYCNLSEQILLISELEGHILKCARDQNANHVLQRILERVPSDRLGFIPAACVGQIFSLATHPYGCRVLQRILENLNEVDTRPLLEEFHKYSQNLIQDQYGNYVAQYILEKGSKADRTFIINKVRGQVVQLAKHKFASNVVDKVVLAADDEERRALTDEILYDPNGVASMLKDQYANYPIQKFLLTVPAGPQRDLLLSRTADSLNHLRKFSGGTQYSKHLMAIERWIIEKPV